MIFKKDFVIIGGGPAGLYFANLCEKENFDYVLFEATSNLGGQLIKLYPEKDIVDIPGIDLIKAKDYISLLLKSLDKEKLILNTKIEKIENYSVFANENEYHAKYIVICSGLGFSTPRPLGLEDEQNCENIFYSLKNFDFLTNKKVAIFGGGDSALDWAKQISSISDNVHLIHRRTEFRGNPETINDCSNLHIHLPYIPFSVERNGKKAETITIINANQDTNDKIIIPVDYILVNFGNIASNTNFGFKQTGAFIDVGDNNIVQENIFAIGDVANYGNKKRRIAPLIEECQKVMAYIKH